MPIQVKICGLKDPDAVRITDEAGADWIGFNFVEKSVRYVTPAAVASLLLPIRRATPVALLADPDDAAVDAAAETGIGILQLHGSETPARLAEIKARTGLDVWKAIGVSERADLDAAGAFTAADRLLIDAKPPGGAAVTGGHGTAFDWSILEGWAAPKPWFLAGGLTADTVANAIRVTGATAVDAASGVEKVRGWKDPALVRAFMDAVKTV